MKIKWFQDPIDPQHLNCLWYGGRLFEIKHKGYTFIVGAFGDVQASLIAPDTGEMIADVKDKCNSGWFYEEMSPYIISDEKLNLYEQKGWLTFANNNWLEVLIDGPDGEQYDSGWVLDTDHILDAVSEVADGMDEMIGNIKEE